MAKKRTSATRAEGQTAPTGNPPVRRTSRVGEQYREIQQGIDAKDKRRSTKKDEETKKAVHAGDRKQPENPLPSQHLTKPGLEADLEL